MNYYAYIRVSTTRQKTEGVSPQEQRGAIARYAEQHRLRVVEWFEESVTAAKEGRPQFAKMMKGLVAKKVQGVIIYKVDRSMRNQRDWVDIGRMIDAGVDVRFVVENLDLNTRGGRLTADLLAVLAVDYIRNLTADVRLGMTGRLKQGLLPLPAPLGYCNHGAGKPKSIDSSKGPLVREAFELYASGQHTLESIASELNKRGLRNRRGRPVSHNSISDILNNPFYAGLIRVKVRGETYPGVHEPLIPMSLFKTVQQRLRGHVRTHRWIHDFAFRGIFTCSLCGRLLTGERQKGHCYYRCHTKGCPTHSFRQEVLERALLCSWGPLSVTPEQCQQLKARIAVLARKDQGTDNAHRSHIRATLGTIEQRQNRLVDALLDGTLDQLSFQQRKQALLEEERSLRDALDAIESDAGVTERFIEDTFELASVAQRSHIIAEPAEQRELAIKLCSNRTVAGKYVSVKPHIRLVQAARYASIAQGGPYQGDSRTAWKIWSWAKRYVRWQQVGGSPGSLPLS